MHVENWRSNLDHDGPMMPTYINWCSALKNYIQIPESNYWILTTSQDIFYKIVIQAPELFAKDFLIETTWTLSA